jgi:23S rRNA (cytosine1962-C5)-methyltransferase
VTVNNALYVSGKDYMETLNKICVDGYVTIDELIAVPSDFTGNVTEVYDNAITDPAPFNHSTKIAVLKVNRKMP